MAITNNVGSLKIQITNNNFFPVEGASVYISPTGMPDSTSEEFVTDKMVSSSMKSFPPPMSPTVWSLATTSHTQNTTSL